LKKILRIFPAVKIFFLNLEIKHIEPSDWQAVAYIYKLGIDTGIATFENIIPSWEKWDQSHLKTCRLAAWLDNTLVGWAALSPVSDRGVYGGVAEVSVYVDSNHSGKGIGTELLENLIIASENEGIWTLQAGIFRENEVSIRLHKKVGFREIGYREKVGKKNEIWYDNVILERRSKIVGID
jgi:phosphinothricin acetyltransferase